jgi:hypothetical protein
LIFKEATSPVLPGSPPLLTQILTQAGTKKNPQPPHERQGFHSWNEDLETADLGDIAEGRPPDSFCDSPSGCSLPHQPPAGVSRGPSSCWPGAVLDSNRLWSVGRSPERRPRHFPTRRYIVGMAHLHNFLVADHAFPYAQRICNDSDTGAPAAS